LGRGYPDDERINPADDGEYGLLLDEWLPILRESGIYLGVFAYYQLVFHDETRRDDRSRYLRYPAPGLVRDEISKFLDCGMLVYYDCSWPYPGAWPDSRLFSYHSALLWNKTADPTGLIQEYFSSHSDFFSVLDAFCAKLDAGIRDIPETDYHNMVKAAAYLPEEFKIAILLWLEYVKLACSSWIFAQKNDTDAVLKTEREIIRLFEENTDSLKMYIDTNWMINYSKSVIGYYSSGKE
jgi:hypothetical protein